MRKLQIFEAARKTRDRYKALFDETNAAREAEKKKILSDFRPGQRMQEELAQCESRYSQKLDDARSRLRMEFDTEITKQRAEIMGRIQHVPVDSMRLLSALDGIAVSDAEFQALLDGYGNKSPWLNRQLAVLAERNNLDVGDRLDPPADAILRTLSALETAVHDYLSEHGDFTIRIDSAVSDRRIYALSDTLYKAGRDPGLSSAEKAERAITKAGSANDIISRAALLGNGWNSADEETRMEILKILATGDRTTLSGDVLRMSGIYDRVEDFKAKDAGHAQKAAEAVETLRNNPDNWYKASEILTAAGGKNNPYLRKAVNDAFDSKDLQLTMDAMGIPDNSVSGADSSSTASDT